MDAGREDHYNKKYTNPARGILDFCKQNLWPLPCSQLTNKNKKLFLHSKKSWEDYQVTKSKKPPLWEGPNLLECKSHRGRLKLCTIRVVLKSECPRKSKSRKLQKIDFLLTKPIEVYRYRIKPSDISFALKKKMAAYFIPHQYPSMC